MPTNPGGDLNVFLDTTYDPNSFTAIDELFEPKQSNHLISTPSKLDKDSKDQKVVILDFGSQYSELIARRVRELKVYSEVLPFNVSIEKIRLMNPKGIILSGGPASVYERGAPEIDSELFDLGIPVLGVCYGMQVMVLATGGKVSPVHMGGGEYGRAKLFIDSREGLFSGLEDNSITWMSHGDSVVTLPDGFQITGHTARTPIAAVANTEKDLYGVQFHPEVVHSEKGMEILANFVYRIADCSPNWTTGRFIDNAIQEIKNTVGNGKVLLALSGGVDSSALAFLLNKAIGDQLTCMFIDQGFMRLNEPEKLVQVFQDQFKIPVQYVNAKERFLNKVRGVEEPELKRKIIGEEFIRVFEEESQRLGPFDFLAQGTLYPDIIESAGAGAVDAAPGERVAVKIKSHHNVGGLPENIKFKLLEPFRKLFKDEVRRVARELGVPTRITKRHPFPGPGLAIRIIGEITEERLNILRQADYIVRDEIQEAGLYDNVWQIFAVLLANIRSVGVMGDKRTYAYPVVIRAIKSEDGMTADWARLPYEVLEKISTRIINEVSGINRVVYDVTSKPPGTIEWE
ncbi:MAG: glutamine-hydrolyzing GMP synthase [Candidatus Caenarcaniphilales bacterium]|nr:glutamine-hydrolyzing GMP synthase [Candidatus Caenarcaniphilales bacterium]